MTLVRELPEIKSDVRGDRVQVIDEDTTRMSINIANETLDKLSRIGDLLSHVMPGARFGEVLDRVADDWLDRHDPLRRESRRKEKDVGSNAKGNTSEGISEDGKAARRKKSPHQDSAAVKRQVKRQDYRETLQRADAACEYIDEATGKVCGSTFQVQVDHIVPVALGGKDELSNYRCLCRKHNILVAQEKLGYARANAWRSYLREPKVLYMA